MFTSKTFKNGDRVQFIRNLSESGVVVNSYFDIRAGFVREFVVVGYPERVVEASSLVKFSEPIWNLAHQIKVLKSDIEIKNQNEQNRILAQIAGNILNSKKKKSK